MTGIDDYRSYARAALADFAKRDAARRDLLADAVGDREIGSVLDIGCGAGQELLPFAAKFGAFCVGIDIAPELGAVSREIAAFSDEPEKIRFARSAGENLPFADASFDAVLCRVALPYMHNARAIAEVARVLRTGGVYLLKIHAPAFYFGMIRERAKTLSAKQLAYPLICLAGGTFRRVTGRQLQNGLWRGKEVFQTRESLRGELTKNNLRIERELADTNAQTPSFLIVKDK